VIHHTKKAGVDDFVDEVSGTFGLTGAADAIVVLSRVARGRLDGILKLTGRDVEEQELPLKFDPLLGTWVITDDGDVVKAGRSMERNTLIDFVEGFPGKTPTEISKILAKKPENVKSLLWRMSADGEVRALNGKYYPIR
jgi:hypothetical protein